jgi:hypothetical protein
MQKIRILGVKVSEKIKHPEKIQQIFSMYGNIIRTRIGLNEEKDGFAQLYGIILLELYGDEKQFDALEKKLHAINGIDVQSMNF